MKTNMKIPLLLAFALISLNAFSQTETMGFEIPDYAAKSPEAASFLKYGDYPVNLATGIPGISIPLYTIEANGISIPITLNYHASGIKVTEEATWVGLGWNINYGAQIILSVKDAVDEGNAQINNLPNPANVTSYYNSHPYAFTGGPISNEQLDKSRVRDIYNFSSPTANGSFYIDNGTFVVFPPDAFQVSRDPYVNGERPLLGIKFKITDASGNVYLFKTEEISVRQFTHGDTYTSAWYADKIITLNKDVIDFVYEGDGDLIEYDWTESYDVYRSGNLCGCPGNQSSFSNGVSPLRVLSGNTTTRSKKISEIIFNGGKSKVVFVRQAGRQDLVNANSVLDKLEIRHINPGTSDFSLIRGYDFIYDYFNSNATGTLAYRNKRLKLTSIETLLDGDTHRFEYSSAALPSKRSQDQDFYGYFNNAHNNSMVPTAPNSSIQPGNRNVNPDYNQAGILTEIHYPAKGYTKFTFETNQYYQGDGMVYEGISLPLSSGDYHPTLSFPDTFNQAQMLSTSADFVVENNNTTATVSWTVRNNVPQALHLLNHQFVRLKIKKNNVVIYNGPNKTREETSSTTVNLSTAGTYTFILECYGKNVQMNGTLTLRNGHMASINPYVAGLRVAKIENFENDGIPLTRKVYNYNDAVNVGRSSGKLVVEDNPVNYTTRTMKTYSTDICPGTNFQPALVYDNTYSVTSVPQFSLKGNTVAYQYVKETDINVTDNSKNGYTLYKFTTGPDYVIHPTLVFDMSWKRGQILEKTIYKSVGTFNYELQKTINTYNEDTRKTATIRGFKMLRFANVYIDEDPAHPMTPPPHANLTDCGVPQNVNSTFQMLNYTFDVPWQYLKSTEITENFYDSTNTLTGTVITNKTYNYNNTAHLQLSSELTSTSTSGETIESRYFYPGDTEVSTEPCVADLIAKNMISKPLKTQHFRGSTILSEQITKYKNWGNYIIQPESLQAYKGGLTANIETKIRFNLVDNNNGNVLEMQKEHGIKICYIWGYNKTKPVAKILGVNYTSIPQQLITAIQSATNSQPLTQTRLSSPELSILTALNNLRNDPALANAMITTYTYRPLTGVSTITDPVGFQMRYEYDEQGRLLVVRDINDNILSENQYHVKP